MAGLEVQIGADITDFEKKIKEVEHDIKDLSKVKLDQIKLGLDTKAIDANIKDAKKSLSDLKNAVKDSGSTIGGDFTKKVANGGNALTQFSRIAQDAPFGIMGIGNNITATTESFGHLIKETGSAGGALKAVASSMMGTGGILLAVSLVTTGLTYMSQNGLTVKDVFEKLTGTFDERARALNDINKEAAKTAGEEIAGLKALVSVAQDRTLSDEKRLIAVKELQKTYPAYFGNLTKEKILNGDVSVAVDDVSRALLARARASAVAGKLGELAAKRLDLEEKREAAILKIQEKQQAVRDALNKGQSATFAPGQGVQSKADIRVKELATVSAEYREIQREIQELDAISRKYSNQSTKDTKDSILLLQEEEKQLKKKKVYSTPQVKGVKSELVSAPQIDPLTIETFTGQVDQFGNKIKELPNIFRTGTIDANKALNIGFQGMSDSMMQFNKAAESLIEGALTETFTSLGTMIGNSLAGADGGLKDAGKNILGILGKFMAQFGELMISTGVGLLIADIALKSGNPYAMIAGGVALVAVGAAFAASSKQQRSSGITGGDRGSSPQTGASYSSPSSSGGASSSFAGGTVVFEIAGTSLIGVLNNTLDKNKRLGGNLPIG